jgi:subtilisin family serine protease
VNPSRPSSGRVAPPFRAVLLFAALLIVLGGCSSSDSFQGMSKSASGQTTRFFAMVRSQPHLEGAASIRDFGARGAYVVNELKRDAAATQGPVIALLEQRGAKYQAYWIANMIWVEGDDETRKQLAELPEVESIEPDATITLNDPVVPMSSTIAASPDTTGSDAQFNVSRVHAPDVWSQGYRGKGVVVGIIDTGVYPTHAALTGRSLGAANMVDKTCVACDENGHGTHVTGTILGTGSIGVAPEAKFVSCRALNKYGSGTISSVVGCMQWMADLTSDRPRVINMSLGGGFSDPMAEPIKHLLDIGTLVVAAAGNQGSCKSVGSPAGFGDVLAVGALTEDETANKMAAYSSGGPSLGVGVNKPDVVAQGSLVNSAWIGSPTAYKTISGTSMASPAVAGVAALLLSAKPDLTPADLAEILKWTADGNVTGAKCAAPNSFGTGLVDANRALEEALQVRARPQ